MRRALLALVVPVLVAACSGGFRRIDARPHAGPRRARSLAVGQPRPRSRRSSARSSLQPVALNVPSSGAEECDYVGAQASVSIVFSPAVVSPELLRELEARRRSAPGGPRVPSVGDDAFYVLTSAAFNGGLLAGPRRHGHVHRGGCRVSCRTPDAADARSDSGRRRSRSGRRASRDRGGTPGLLDAGRSHKVTEEDRRVIGHGSPRRRTCGAASPRLARTEQAKNAAVYPASQATLVVTGWLGAPIDAQASCA